MEIGSPACTLRNCAGAGAESLYLRCFGETTDAALVMTVWPRSDHYTVYSVSGTGSSTVPSERD